MIITTYLRGNVDRVWDAIQLKKFDLFHSPQEIADIFVCDLDQYSRTYQGEYRSDLAQQFASTSDQLHSLYRPFMDGFITPEAMVANVKATYRAKAKLLREFRRKTTNIDHLTASLLGLGVIESVYKTPDVRLAEALKIAKPRLKPLIERLEKQ